MAPSIVSHSETTTFNCSLSQLITLKLLSGPVGQLFTSTERSTFDIFRLFFFPGVLTFDTFDIRHSTFQSTFDIRHIFLHVSDVRIEKVVHGRKGLIVRGHTGPRTAKIAKVQGSLPHISG